jgi:hypothetical protein
MPTSPEILVGPVLVIAWLPRTPNEHAEFNEIGCVQTVVATETVLTVVASTSKIHTTFY